VIPFILDYRAMGKVLEVNALGAVAEKIQNLEKLAAQIFSPQKNGRTRRCRPKKTSTVAKEIADRMAEEIRLFSEFMEKMNDSGKPRSGWKLRNCGAANSNGCRCW